jgi:hypothetical protein
MSGLGNLHFSKAVIMRSNAHIRGRRRASAATVFLAVHEWSGTAP